MTATKDVGANIDQVFRREHGRIIARLIRLCSSFDRAEEAMQEGFAAALANWPAQGIPANPAAWITSVANRKLIDTHRRSHLRRAKQAELEHEILAAAVDPAEADEPPSAFPDDRLRLIFTCCHPALNREAQIALTLRTLGGLSTAEIARAFLVPEPTLAQRLVRAKRKIQDAGIPYEVPGADQIGSRRAAVQAVIYLIFNEGYLATAGAALVRGELCEEAIRLGRMLCEIDAPEPENLGLLALMLLHHSRRKARADDTGRFVTLEDQDRSLWDCAMIREGLGLVERALRHGPPGPYRLQAAIAAVHAEAATAAATDWRRIAAFYSELAWINPTPVILLNRAVAIGLGEDLRRGLALVDALSGLDNYHLYHAARADLLRRLGRFSAAKDAYRRALALTDNQVERTFLDRRLAAL